MTTAAWAAVLQYSRLGVTGLLFLVMARTLSLTEIGAFAFAFAPMRLMQVVLRHGLVDACVVSARTASVQNAFFAIALLAGSLFAAALVLIGLCLPAPVGPLMITLGAVPLLQGISAIPEATLRRDLRIRALALRTLFAQGIAAVLAVGVLNSGWGAFSLVVFVVVNALTSGAIAIALAGVRPTALPTRTAMRRALPDIARISARDLAGGAILPLLQLAVGAVLGLPAAGALQIAARVHGLIDALAVSPLRFVSLPKFSTAAGTPALPRAILRSLRIISLTSGLAYLGAIAAAPEIAALVAGPENGAAAAPLLPAFCLFGLICALGTPLNQGLTASGQTRLTLQKAVATVALTCALAIPALAVSTQAVAATLPVAGAVVLLPYAWTGLPRLGVPLRAALGAIAPALLAGAFMVMALTVTAPILTALPTLPGLVLKAILGAGFYAALLIGFAQLRPTPAAQ